MNLPLSPAVERALASARPADSVGLLAELLAEAEGRAAELLREHGWSGVTPAGGAGVSVEAVLAEARSARPGRLTSVPLITDHLLIGLLVADADARSTLIGDGLDWDRLRAAVAGDAPGRIDPVGPIEPDDPFGATGTARALDASANRAREALRVVEDYCRFVLDDRFLTEQLKGLRHELASALGGVSERSLLASRETARDVGTDITLGGETRRFDPRHVARVNLKRLQEALRSLEEFGKIDDPVLAARVEQIRYRAYTLERAILRDGGLTERLAAARLYVLLTGSRCTTAMDWVIREAAAGGAEVFQLREKDLDDRSLLERARLARRWTREAGALFIVNDRPDIARLCEADGVHLGQDDVPVKEARQILGPRALVGVSTHDLGQLRAAILDGADYVGIGPTFPSRTKEFAELAGLDFVRAAVAETTLPAFAIGGIGPENIGEVIAAGAVRVAVGTAVTEPDDPRLAALALRSAL